jgi:hypothetical protein
MPLLRVTFDPKLGDSSSAIRSSTHLEDDARGGVPDKRCAPRVASIVGDEPRFRADIEKEDRSMRVARLARF